MNDLRGWWRHAVLAGGVVGLIVAPAVPAPAGWLPCVLAGGVALGALGRWDSPERDPSRIPVAALILLAAALAVLAGLGIGGARLDAISGGALSGPVGVPVEVDGYVTGTPDRSFGEVSIPLETVDGRVLVRAREPVPEIAVGTALSASGRLERAAEGFDEARLERLGATLELVADRVRPESGDRGGITGLLDRVRTRAEEALEAGTGDEQSALARGFVLGQDDRIDPATREAFTRAGLSHLLAVSGQNVMLLAILGGLVFALFGAGLRTRLVLTLLLIAAYVPIAGAGPSIQRAGVMGAAGIAATLVGRPTDRAYPLLLAAAVTLVVNPRFGADVGWRLSFAALIGIILWARPLRELLVPPLRRRLPDRLAAPLAEGLALTFAATVATAPLIAHDFEQLSVAALPANLVVLPLVAPVMWVGMAIGMLAQLPPVQLGPLDPIILLGGIEGHLVALVAGVAEVFAAPGWAQVDLTLPGPVAVGVTYLILASTVGVAVMLARRRRELATPRLIPIGLASIALLALLPLALRPDSSGAPAPDTLRITALDVGQGDSILIQPPRGDPVLVDGGPPGGAAADALGDLGIERLRAVFVTHDELDHAGGLFEVLQRVDTDMLVHARPAPLLESAARDRGVRVVVTAEGSAFDFGRLELDVLWPPRESLTTPAEDRNFDGIVLAARFAGYDALLSADAEEEVTRLDPGPLDVLKIAHHGSDDAGLEGLIERSVPRLALVSVGEGNSYGHPTSETLATLESHGVCALRTDVDGAATVELGPGGLDAWTEAGPPPAERPGCSAAPG